MITGSERNSGSSTELPESVEPAQAGHGEIEDQHFNRVAADELERAAAVGRERHGETSALEARSEDRPDGLIVVRNEDDRCGRRAPRGPTFEAASTLACTSPQIAWLRLGVPRR